MRWLAAMVAITLTAAAPRLAMRPRFGLACVMAERSTAALCGGRLAIFAIDAEAKLQARLVARQAAST